MMDPETTLATRREFVLSVGAVAGGALASRSIAAPIQEIDEPPQQAEPPQQEPARRSDLDVNERTIAEAEKLAGVQFTDAERTQLLQSIPEQIERLVKRMAWELPANDRAPAAIFDPCLPGTTYAEDGAVFEPSRSAPPSLPERDEDIAFAPVIHLAHWLRTRALTSTRLTEIYLNRLKRFGPTLECVVTLTEDLAFEQAARADAEIARGAYRGPLHGVPWGAKDLFDTTGIPTTWGAMPYRTRVPESDAVVVRRLEEAGAVLVAKLTLGALAYGDRWFDGRTRNPWNLEQGSSGSSAGSAAATVTGLVGFSLGTETYGSIVSPCMRCGATGLRPTFGRVARTGAMALCWSLDKIGPICRTVEDCMLVLDAINGADEGDPSSIEMPLLYDAAQPLRGLRVGYDPNWFNGRSEPEAHREVLDALEAQRVRLTPIELPDWPYRTLESILMVEAAAAFEALTLSGDDDELVRQDDDAWPNLFRQARFIPGIEVIQAERFRRQVMEMMAEQFESVDAMIGPSFAGNMLLLTNFTGHPSLTLRTGFRENGTPRGITLWGDLYDEGTICNLGRALERDLGVWQRRPELA